jgi:hypothetical protein
MNARERRPAQVGLGEHGGFIDLNSCDESKIS